MSALPDPGRRDLGPEVTAPGQMQLRPAAQLSRVLFYDDYAQIPVGALPRDYTSMGEYQWQKEPGTSGAWHEATNTRGAGGARAIHSFAIVEEDGRRYLEQRSFLERANAQIAAGDVRWRDYQFSTSIRLFSERNGAGLLFRYQTSRSHFAFLLEGNCVRLIRRCDEDEIELAAAPCQPDFDRYRDVAVECEGPQLRCYLDGNLVLQASDGALPEGRVGFVGTHMARYGPVTVRTTPAAHSVYVARLTGEQKALAAERERLPKPALWKRFSTPGFGAGKAFRFGDLDGDGRDEIVIAQNMHHVGYDGWSMISCLTALNVDGQILWQIGEPNPDHGMLYNDVCFQIHDIDGDGANEVVFTKDFKIQVVEGRTGRLKAWAPTPRPGPVGRMLQEDVTYRICGDALRFCDLAGRGAARDFIIKDRYHNAWAYSPDLHPLWQFSGDTGHYPFNYDIDGDGRDEVMIGYTMLNAEGAVLWTHTFSDHVDGIAIGPFGPAEETGIALACGNEGVMLLDLNGRIVHRDIPGHAQCVNVAKLRNDIPGLQIATITYWTNPGIVVVYDWQGRRLHVSEPINVGSHLSPVNWAGDGIEQLLLNTDPQKGGLLDAFGRPVVLFPDDHHPDLCCEPVNLTGDARDEIVTWDRNEVWIYTQDRPAPPDRYYVPERVPHYNYSNYRAQVSLPRWGERASGP